MQLFITRDKPANSDTLIMLVTMCPSYLKGLLRASKSILTTGSAIYTYLLKFL